MAETTLSVDVVPVETPDDITIIIGQAHFIKNLCRLRQQCLQRPSSASADLRRAKDGT